MTVDGGMKLSGKLGGTKSQLMVPAVEEGIFNAKIPDGKVKEGVKGGRITEEGLEGIHGEGGRVSLSLGADDIEEGKDVDGIDADTEVEEEEGEEEGSADGLGNVGDNDGGKAKQGEDAIEEAVDPKLTTNPISIT